MKAITEDYYPCASSAPDTFVISDDMDVDGGTTEKFSTNLIDIEGCTCNFSHLTLTQDIVLKDNSHLVLDECVFMPKFRSHTAAIDVTEKSELTIKNSHLFNDEGVCIRLTGLSKSAMTSVIFAGDGHVMILVTLNSTADLRNCYFNSIKCCLMVQSSGECQINRCEFTNLSEIPITVLHNGFCSATDSIFRLCPRGAFSIIDNSSAELDHCEFDRSGGNLICLRKSSTIRLESTKVSNIGESSVIQAGQSKVKIVKCEISSSCLVSIEEDASQVEVEESTISNTIGKGIVCSHGAKLDVKKSSIKAQTIGVFSGSESIAFIDESDVSGFEGGIIAEGKAEAIVRSTKVASTGGDGIVGLKDGKITADSCDAQDCGGLSIYLHRGAVGFFSQNRIKDEIRVDDSPDPFTGRQAAVVYSSPAKGGSDDS